MTEILPEDIDASYRDRSPGDQQHQHHHDVIHTRLNGLADEIEAAILAGGAGSIDLGDLQDVDTSGATSGQVLKYNGTTWVADDDEGTATVTSDDITDATAVGKDVLTATDAAAARTAIGAGTSNLALGTSGSTAKAGNYAPAAADISDSTSTGRSVLTAADAATARTAIGAGTSDLAIGTTSSTAMAGNKTAADLGGVLTSRTIAGLALSADISAASLTAALSAATDTAKGTVELATNAETLTGTDTTRAVTPAGVAAVSATAPLIVEWTGSAWPSYSTSATRIRQFYSQDDPDAVPPTAYNAHDLWFFAEEV